MKTLLTAFFPATQKTILFYFINSTCFLVPKDSELTPTIRENQTTENLGNVIEATVAAGYKVEASTITEESKAILLEALKRGADELADSKSWKSYNDVVNHHNNILTLEVI